MKYQIILLLLFCFISLTAQNEYLVKLKNLETLDNESITNISLLDDQHVLLTSTGAFDENQPYNWKLINRKFNVEDMSVVWKKYYTHTEDYTMSPNSVIRNKKGNVIITGSTKHDDASSLDLDRGNAFIVEMNPEGGLAVTRLWESMNVLILLMTSLMYMVLM